MGGKFQGEGRIVATLMKTSRWFRRCCTKNAESEESILLTVYATITMSRKGTSDYNRVARDKLRRAGRTVAKANCRLRGWNEQQTPSQRRVYDVASMLR
jgi:hypothetical protein